MGYIHLDAVPPLDVIAETFVFFLLDLLEVIVCLFLFAGHAEVGGENMLEIILRIA